MKQYGLKKCKNEKNTIKQIKNRKQHDIGSFKNKTKNKIDIIKFLCMIDFEGLYYFPP